MLTNDNLTFRTLILPDSSSSHVTYSISQWGCFKLLCCSELTSYPHSCKMVRGKICGIRQKHLQCSRATLGICSICPNLCLTLFCDNGKAVCYPKHSESFTTATDSVLPPFSRTLFPFYSIPLFSVSLSLPA